MGKNFDVVTFGSAVVDTFVDTEEGIPAIGAAFTKRGVYIDRHGDNYY